ncbi:PEPxxWA-CTERM sorting domain-containing protein [Sphingobium nicotianae]|nr:PEPxxWA-CTERM sorting domain-containing protein [Sphingobium nicotianae]
MLRIFLAALALAGLPPAQAATNNVDFSGIPDGPADNPLHLDGMIFSTPGFNYVTGGVLCPSPTAANSADCGLDLTVDFGGLTSGISFDFLYNNETTIGADIGDVQIFSGATLLGIVDVIVTDGDPFTQDLVSLAGFTDVTRLVISSTDFGGVGYDDFMADVVPPPGSVPEPASWALMIGGFALAGGLMRRRAMALSPASA